MSSGGSLFIEKLVPGGTNLGGSIFTMTLPITGTDAEDDQEQIKNMSSIVCMHHFEYLGSGQNQLLAHKSVLKFAPA